MPSSLLHARVALAVALATAAGLVLLTPAPAVAQSGTINFTVTNAATGSPVAGATIFLVSSTGVSLGNFTTGPAGTYAVAFLPPGTYHAYTGNTAGLVNEFYDNFVCPVGYCTPQLAASSTPIVLTPGAVRAASFALLPGATITGTVRDAATSSPLAGVGVRALIQSGGGWMNAGQGFTNAAGAYAIDGLAPGSYQVSTAAPAAYVDEFFDDVPCPGSCDPWLTIGSPITVTSGTVAGGRDFGLSIGGQLTGTVTDATTGTPVPSVAVFLHWRTPNGQGFKAAGSAVSDATGQFTVRGLPSGVYVAFTDNNVGYIDETFDNIPCSGSCGALGAADIPVTTGQTTARNIGLDRGGTVAGSVRNAATSAPLAGVGIDLYARRSDTVVPVGSTQTDVNGAYAVTGLPTGSYYASTRRVTGFIPAIYPSSQCAGDCSSWDTVSQGQPIDVVAGTTTGGRNFSLTPGGQITGVITDSSTGGPAANVGVTAVTRVGAVVTRADVTGTNASGAFTLSGLPGATYYLYTHNGLGLVDEVYPGVPCLGQCSADFAANAGTAIVVTTGATTSGQDLALSPGGRITGTVIDADTGARVDGIGVQVYANVGGSAQPAGTVWTDALGRFVVGQLPAGAYYAASLASNATQLVNEIYDNLPCTLNTFCTPEATVAAGTPIQVAAGATAASRDFTLQRRQAPPGAPWLFSASSTGFDARFTWLEPQTGGAPSSYRIEAGGAPGTTSVALAATGTSLTVPGAPAGRFYVRVRAVNAFGEGPPSEEVVLNIAANGASPPAAPQALTAFMTGARLVATWAAPYESGPIDGYRVEAGTASGLANIATISVGARSFSFEPVPAGFYFLRVRAFSAAGVSRPSNELLINVGGVPSPPGMAFLHTPVVTGSTVSLSWSAPRGGTVSGYVLEAGTSSGLANLVVHNTGTAATTASFSGVAPGAYYVRIRAANSLGAGIASNEVIVVVR